MSESKKRALNGSVPRYCDPGYKTSYQKLRDRVAALEAVAEAAKEQHEREHGRPCYRSMGVPRNCDLGVALYKLAALAKEKP